MYYKIQIVEPVYTGDDPIFLVFFVFFVMTALSPAIAKNLADRRKRKKEESEE